jgi:phosphate transport system substrate-binding protein
MTRGLRVFACFIALALAGPVSHSDENAAEKVELADYKKVEGIEGTIVSVGSDTLNNLMTLWAEGFREHYPKFEFCIEGQGSTPGPWALTHGTTDLAPSARLMKDVDVEKFKQKQGYEPSVIVVAIDALAVFVHKDNPVEKLSLAQLDAIFSSTRKREYAEDITRWGQVGLEDDWENLDITLYGRNSASGYYAFFKEKALSKGDFKKSVKEQPGSATVVKQVSEDRSASGYSGIAYKTDGVRAVPVSATAEDTACEATRENCYDDKYPLSRRLYIYFNRKPGENLKPHIREFLKFIHSKQGQEAVTKDGFVSLNQKLVDDSKAAYEDK